MKETERLRIEYVQLKKKMRVLSDAQKARLALLKEALTLVGESQRRRRFMERDAATLGRL